MKNHLNPIHKNGDRNLFCANYSDCLDHAAVRHWKYWSCANCEYKLISQPAIHGPVTSDETPLYYDISQDIHRKYV